MTKQYIQVKNWAEFQHYKDRKPLWIKMYLSLLEDDDPYDTAYTDLTDTEKCHLHHIWLLASKHGNRIPYIDAWLQGKLNIKSKLNLKNLINSGFVSIVDDDGSELSKPEPKPNKPAIKKKKDELNQALHIMNATASHIEAYAKSIGFSKLVGQEFIDYYKGQDWKKANGRPLTDWQCGVRAWHKREYPSKREQNEAMQKQYNNIVVPLGDKIFTDKLQGHDIEGNLDAIDDQYRTYKRYNGRTIRQYVEMYIKQLEGDESERIVARQAIEDMNKPKGQV